MAEDHDIDLILVKGYACGNLIPLFVSMEYAIPAVLRVVKSIKII